MTAPMSLAEWMAESSSFNANNPSSTTPEVATTARGGAAQSAPLMRSPAPSPTVASTTTTAMTPATTTLADLKRQREAMRAQMADLLGEANVNLATPTSSPVTSAMSGRSGAAAYNQTSTVAGKGRDSEDDAPQHLGGVKHDDDAGSFSVVEGRREGSTGLRCGDGGVNQLLQKLLEQQQNARDIKDFPREKEDTTVIMVADRGTQTHTEVTTQTDPPLHVGTCHMCYTAHYGHEPAAHTLVSRGRNNDAPKSVGVGSGGELANGIDDVLVMNYNPPTFQPLSTPNCDRHYDPHYSHYYHQHCPIPYNYSNLAPAVLTRDSPASLRMQIDALLAHVDRVMLQTNLPDIPSAPP